MPESHLKPDQITAIRDMELRDPGLIRHLRSCPDCQARLREARLLRVLLAWPEQKRSAHPAAEDLAAYLEGRLAGINLAKFEGHVAGCPQCFSELETIQSHMRPITTVVESPPERVVAAAARNFQPPWTPPNLGTLVVQWLQGLGLSLELLPPETGPAVAGGGLAFLRAPAAYSGRAWRVIADAKEEMERDLPASRPELRSMAMRAAEIQGELAEWMRLYERLAEEVDELRNSLVGAPGILDAIGDQAARLRKMMLVEVRNTQQLLGEWHALVEHARVMRERISVHSESEPVAVELQDLRVTIRALGRAPERVRMAVGIIRQQDKAPVSGAQLVLKTEGAPDVTATTDAAGTAEFPLPQGQATLVFQSPVRAELQISY